MTHVILWVLHMYSLFESAYHIYDWNYMDMQNLFMHYLNDGGQISIVCFRDSYIRLLLIIIDSNV